MKVNEQQLQMLFFIASWSIHYDFIGYNIPFDLKTRGDLVNNILNQQSKELKEIE